MRKKFILKSVAFLLILCAMLSLINGVLIPKYTYSNTYPTTSTYLGFYELEKNTADVLFLGSSNAVTAFSPSALYESHGITSYNIGCEQQNLVVSYYWLKEALKYQSPSTVVLDAYLLFTYNAEETLNSSEAMTRKAIDYMRWSSVKAEAVRTICELDSNQSLLSYYMPNIRFHTRWTSLNEEDFLLFGMDGHLNMKGFSAVTSSYGSDAYKPFSGESASGIEDMEPLMEEYLEKITELCREEGIRLILTKTPCYGWNAERYSAVLSYAEKHGLDYFDFNEETLYNEVSFQFASDCFDSSHVNFRGAMKLTGYIGDYLSGECGVAPRTEPQWELTREYFEGVKKDAALCLTEIPYYYLELLDDDRYTIFIAARDDASTSLNGRLLERLRSLGLDIPLEGRYRSSYLAVIVGGEGCVTELVGDRLLTAQGTIRGGKTSYEITSAGFSCGNTCSISINGRNYALNLRGLNIVVYDCYSNKVVDSVCIDTYAPELPLYR